MNLEGAEVAGLEARRALAELILGQRDAGVDGQIAEILSVPENHAVRHAAVHVALEEAHGLLARRVVAEGVVHLRVDEPGDRGGLVGVDDDIGRLDVLRGLRHGDRHRHPAQPADLGDERAVRNRARRPAGQSGQPAMG